jgi:hypothetical protein
MSRTTVSKESRLQSDRLALLVAAKFASAALSEIPESERTEGQARAQVALRIAIAKAEHT